ncbi:MAG TPA: trypsin-like peptidase domain-containing protein [Solirubrobacteraceae bacterium]|nr:trypsin-like peptidase domain-containing protein [Solirubrobacteraceae bacterium]
MWLGDRLKALMAVSVCLATAAAACAATSAFAAKPEMEVLTKQGVSSVRAEQALALQSRVSETKLTKKLITALGNDYAGVWFEPAAARFHVGVTSNESRRVARLVAAEAGLSTDVVETPVRSTWSALLDAQTRWNHKLARLLASAQAMTGIYVQRNAVEVTLSSSVPGSERATLIREAARDSVTVVVVVAPPSRLHLEYRARRTCKTPFLPLEALCEETITSGTNLWIEGSLACTAGPMLIEGNETYVLTAGHCFNRREAAEERITAVVASEYPNTAGPKEIGREVTRWFNREHDVAEVKVAARSAFEQGLPIPVPALMAEWVREPGTPHAVVGAKAAEEVVPAQEICHEGISSGEPCGEVERVNVTLTSGTYVVEHVVEVSACSNAGDSGGPYFFRVERTNEILMMGTEVGGPLPDCNEKGVYKSYFEPLLEIPGVRRTGSLVLFPGQSLLTTANENRRKNEEEKEKEEKERKEKEGKGGAGNGAWLCNGAEITGTGTNRCLTNAEGEGKFTLEDMKEEAAVECEGSDVTSEGWVGPGSEDETTAVTFKESSKDCKPAAKALNEEGKEVTNKCEEVKEVKAVDLSWTTLLEVLAGKNEDKIKEATKGQPGYTVRCKVSILEVSDECKAKEAADNERVEVENLLGTSTEPPLVTVTFPEETERKAEWADCSLGGAESGLVRGKVLVAALNSGGALESLEVS